MATSLKARLAMANGHNARLCHQAKEEIQRLEKLLLCCRQAALPDPNGGHETIDINWLTNKILEYTDE